MNHPNLCTSKPLPFGQAPTKSDLRYHLKNSFSIPEDRKQCFHTYFILKWDIDYALKSIYNGLITKDGTEYQVVYHKTSPSDLRKFAANDGIVPNSRKVLLSFRAAKQHYKLLPVVMITKVL